MRRIAIIAVSILTLLLFAGCTGNLFMEWDKPDVPSVSEINNRDLTDDSGAESFFSEIENLEDANRLSGDKETSDAIVERLKELYDSGDPDYQPGISDENRQKAAAYAGEIAIKSDPNANELTSNLIGSFPELTDDSGGGADPAELMNSLVPDAVKTDRSAFDAMISALLKSADAYLTFGNSLNDTDADGKIDSESAPFMIDGEFGDTVQRAGTSIAVMAAVDALDGNMNGTVEQAGIDELFNLVNTGSTTWPVSDDPTDAFDDTGAETYAGLGNILDAAGLSFS